MPEMRRALRASRMADVATTRMLVHSMGLHGALKPFERAQRGRHGFRGDKARVEDAAAEPRHLAVFVQCLQPVRRRSWRSSACRSWNRYRWRQKWAWGCRTISGDTKNCSGVKIHDWSGGESNG